MIGAQVFARTLGRMRPPDRYGNRWQYHPRSDEHSKVACWGIMVDLLSHCSLLAEHARTDRVGFGINHQMRDFRVNRKKNLDLVVCGPGGAFSDRTLVDLGQKYDLSLRSDEQTTLDRIPEIKQCPVGNVLIALEAKACMTEHLKARPRLYDELSSSFQTILGDTNSAIAAAFVTINLSPTFISPDRNKRILAESEAEITRHDQPRVSYEVLAKVEELPRRSNPDEAGYDALGVVLVSCANDGSDVSLLSSFSGDRSLENSYTYPDMIRRISHLYNIRFRSL